MTRRRALVVCPGRGTYNVPELGYLARHHAGRADLLAPFEAERRQLGQPTLAELDGAAGYSLAVHTRGDNASALIFAASLADAAAIDTDAIEVVAVTGNSMGW
ncbi:MAG: ACP S-malonyltransferase, partial [Hyphomicrobiaceae bacterium]|nr:ACP S-malonyltransferase [Hyphomicrobiaceae bacterium]